MNEKKSEETLKWVFSINVTNIRKKINKEKEFNVRKRNWIKVEEKNKINNHILVRGRRINVYWKE